MKSINFVVFAILLAVAVCTGARFDLQNCKVTSYDAWDSVQFPVIGGSGDYEYEFNRLPKNWYSSKDKVYAPKGEIEKTGYFSVKVTVADRKYGGVIQNCLIFNF